MTPTLAFALAAAVLVGIVLVLLGWPLLRGGRRPADRSPAPLTQKILRDQLAELERDRAASLLSEEDYRRACEELQRRVLEEIPGPSAENASGAPIAILPGGGRKTAIALLIALPLGTVAGYAWLGAPQALAPAEPQMSRQAIGAMLANLEQKLKTQPDDAKNWVLLARSYKALGRFTDAAAAYAQGGALVDSDPSLLADYAETVARANDGRFDAKADRLIKRALALNPDEPQALFLAGAAAADRGDYAAVIKAWSRLLAQMDKNSDEARAVEAAINDARAKAGQGNIKKKPDAAQLESIRGEVRLKREYAGRVSPDDTVFIFARANEGSRMPLAVLRLRAGDLPYRFVLDDTLALPGGQKLSSQASVTVEARIAKAGAAQISSGDLYGTVAGIKPGATAVRLAIDQIQP